MALRAETEQPKHTESTLAGDGERKKSILIYSPDLNFCFSLSMLFQDRYNVSTTTNLSMLETFVSNYSADLVMIDAVPSARIIERLAGLREASQQIPVIMLYVYNAKEVQLDQAVRQHVDSVFYKPFDVSAVSKRIEELLAI